MQATRDRAQYVHTQGEQAECVGKEVKGPMKTLQAGKRRLAFHKDSAPRLPSLEASDPGSPRRVWGWSPGSAQSLPEAVWPGQKPGMDVSCEL